MSHTGFTNNVLCIYELIEKNKEESHFNITELMC